jgi:hypothetical protein
MCYQRMTGTARRTYLHASKHSRSTDLEMIAAQQPLTAWRYRCRCYIHRLIARPALLPNQRAAQPAHNAACAGLTALNDMQPWHDCIWVSAKDAFAVKGRGTHAQLQV